LRLAASGEQFLHLPEVLGLYLQSPEGIELSDQERSILESTRARERHWPGAWGPRPAPAGHYVIPPVHPDSPTLRLEDSPPSGPGLTLAGAKELHGLGRTDEAIQRLLAVCQSRPGEPGPYLALARFFAFIGLASHGVELIQKVRSTFPPSADLEQALAELEIPAQGTTSIIPTPEADRPEFPPPPDVEARTTLPSDQPARGNAPSILFINTYYPAFLQRHYGGFPDLLQADYETQLDALLRTGFGDSSFYSKGMLLQGWEAGDVIANCEPLQAAWRREQGVNGDAQATLVEQIRRLRPDVVYLQDLSLGHAEFLRQIRPYTRLIAGQIASPIPPSTHVAGFDLIFTSFPHFTEQFRRAGLKAYYQPLAFDPRTLRRLGPRQASLPFTFVGGISGNHARGTELLASIAQGTPLQIWGYGAESLPPGSILRERHHGEAWAMDMFKLLHASAITLNRHIDVAKRFANNMRLFEATGCGAMLITDYKDNLQELFRIGEEVVAYRSPEECIDLVNYYLRHPAEAETIAKAGQARTLRDHTYEKRMGQTAEILERHLRYATSTTPAPFDPAGISYGHQVIQPGEVTGAMTSAWQDPSIPARQRELVQWELADMYLGRPQPMFRALADLLAPILSDQDSVLEIGCASGYYYEILEYLMNRRIAYTGVDYSEPLIEMARQYYPKARFDVADGSALPYRDRQFHCAISSCVLLHTPNFREHIRETVRVADRFVAVHRTPICRTRPTQFLRKFAYGIETVELLFNEREILDAFLQEGLVLERAVEYSADPATDRYETSYLFRVLRDSGHPAGEVQR
jgi:SAM-dependent methyltransferase